MCLPVTKPHLSSPVCARGWHSCVCECAELCLTVWPHRGVDLGRLRLGVCLCAEDVLPVLEVPILSFFVNVTGNLFACESPRL